MVTEGRRIIGRETCVSAILSTINPTSIGLGLNLDLRGTQLLHCKVSQSKKLTI
jgi:hypothetical protein